MRNFFHALHATLLLILSTVVVAVEPNPCEGKYELAFPVAALSNDNDGSGIGGTGVRDNRPAPAAWLAKYPTDPSDGDGIGGTGIVGVISGFGSICVAGQEIHYSQQTPVFIQGKSSASPQLALGQMVSVRTYQKTEGLVAAEILVSHEVRGPIERLSQENSTLSILGQRIIFAAPEFKNLFIGQEVTVSGYRLPDGRIEATRLEKSISKQVSLIGTVESVDTETLVVSGQPVQLRSGQARPERGSEIRLEGILQNGVMRSATWSANPRLAFSRPVKRVLIQKPARKMQNDITPFEGTSAFMREQGQKPPRAERLEPMPSLRRPDTGMEAPTGNRPMNRPELPHGHIRPDVIRHERLEMPTPLPRPPHIPPERPPAEVHR